MDSRTPKTSKLKITPGTLVVLGIFGLALGLAGFAWWWNLSQNQRAIALWGQENVRLIRKAPQVRFLELAESPEKQGSERLEVTGQTYWVTAESDVSQARGLVHARHALADDASFVWSEELTDLSSPQWSFAVRFGQGDSEVTLLFDTEHNRIRCLETGKEASTMPRIMAGWARLVEREMPAE